MGTIVSDIFLSFFAMIDKALLLVLKILISIFDFIATRDFFTADIIKQLYDRIFLFITVFMVFKVSFSIIQYIINPEQFSNGERGFSKVIQGVVLALVGLVLVTPAFNVARDVQKRILDNGVIPALILGAENDNINDGSDAQKIPMYLARTFVVPNKTGFTDEISTHYVYDSTDGYNQYGVSYGYKMAIEHNNTDMLLDLVTAKEDGENGSNSDSYVFNYSFLLSTASIIFVVIMYLNFCLDVAVRTVKLGFLQIVSPIPLISMVDPKSTKNGMMSKWLKNCFSTYAGLFVRIAAVSFVIYGIRILMDTLSKNAETSVGGYINLVLIFGLLLFAKELPKLITDLTGIDMKGDFKLNPLKRIPGSEKVLKTAGTLGKAAIGTGIGAVGGLTANTISAAKKWQTDPNYGVLKGMGSMAAGFFSGGFRGLTSKEKNPIKRGTGAVKAASEARNLRARREREGNGGIEGFVNRRIEDLQNVAGIESGLTAKDNEIKAISDVESMANDIFTRADSEMRKYDTLTIKSKDENGNDIVTSMSEFKRDEEALTTLRNMDTSTFTQDEINKHNQKISELNSKILKNTKSFQQAYVTAVMKKDDSVATVRKVMDANGNTHDEKVFDAQITSRVEGLQREIQHTTYESISNPITKNGMNLEHLTGENIKTLKDTYADKKIEIQQSEQYRQAQVNRRVESGNGH